MKHLLFVLTMVFVPALALSTEEWQIYSNDNYGYEVQYPDSYEVIITGPESERDGRTIRLAMQHISRLHGIDIEIRPGLSLQQIMSETPFPELNEIERGDVTTTTEHHTLTWKKIMLNGAPAVRMEARYAENGDLFMTSLTMDRAVLTAHLDAGLEEELAERIISTFMWKGRADDGPDADDNQ